MFELIIGAAIGAAFFIVPLWAYRRGLKDGLAINNNKPIEPIKTPVQVAQAVQTAKTNNKEEAKQAQYFTNLFSYTGEKQTEISE